MTGQDVLLQRYITLRKAGDGQGALAMAREACEVTPNMPAAHYALGEISSELGDHAGAVTAFVAALRLVPDWADALVNLSIALYRQGKTEAAKWALRKALRFAPDHKAAASNLGVLMRITGEGEGSEALLQAALAREPQNEAARLNLAVDLLRRDRGTEALAVLEGPTISPSAAAAHQWHLTRADVFLSLGRVKSARAALHAFAALGPVPAALAPLWYWRQVLLGQLENDKAATIAAAGKMAAAISVMGPDALPEHRIMAHYYLARFWSGLDEPAIAFTHWTEGHRLLRISQPFSRTTFAEVLATNIDVFTAKRFQNGPRASNRDPAPVFIIGMPRSGTTLCEQILAAHGQVHGAGERKELARAVARLGGPQRIAAMDAAALDEAASAYLKDLHALAPEKARIVDKMPGNELHLGLVSLMLPEAKIIHCVRDPRDIGLSIWTHRFYGEHPYAHDLADLGWTIVQRAKLVQHWHAVLPNQILTVALQDWVRDFDGTLARVLKHLDLPHDPACARFYENDNEVRTVSRAQVRQPINAKGLGRWRRYVKELAPLIAELEAGGLL